MIAVPSASRAMRSIAVATTSLLVSGSAVAQPQSAVTHESAARLPFDVGEVLDYRVSVSFGGNIGQGQMRVEGPVMDRGVNTWRLVSDMKAKRGFVRATDRSVSLLDPVRFASTRFDKVERHPLSSGEENVLIDLAAGTWQEAKGTPQALGNALPLDELSFLYFLRTLPLDKDTTFNFSRHFDEARNPTLVSVSGEETIETPAGSFQTRIVVMHVRDPKHYKGIGLIKINLDTSDCRLPVRIVSRMPIVGSTTLTLVGHGHGTAKSQSGRTECVP
jgi:hypothetical protein